MIARLERLLLKLLQKHAPHLAPSFAVPVAGQEPTLRLQEMAHRLASYNVLVLMGDLSAVPEKDRMACIQDWAQAYGRLHHILAQGLFPAYINLKAHLADENVTQPVMVIEGEINAVIQALAGFVTPYLAARQHRPISELELSGLMHTVLDELQAEDLPRARYTQIHDAAVAQLGRMLQVRIHMITLTPFDRPFGNIQVAPLRATPPRPTGKLPEQDKPKAAAATANVTATAELPSVPVQTPPMPVAPIEAPALSYELERLPMDEDLPDDTPSEQLFRQEVRLSKTDPILPIPRPPGKKSPNGK
ncbi:MAG: hypothetical protein SF029_10035 [bacterium]|nr:hypothetical protein [bacterium]